MRVFVSFGRRGVRVGASARVGRRIRVGASTGARRRSGRSWISIRI